MAAFANSTAPGTSQAVTLETAWGPSKNHPDALASRDCHNGGYAPGEALCNYLTEHSSAEFATYNFRRALACLSVTPLGRGNPVRYERLEAKVSAYGAYGVRGHVKLTVELGPNTENGTEQMEIRAEALPAHRP